MSTKANSPASPLLTKQEAADFLRVSVRTLDRLPIPRVRVRNAVRYRQTTLDEFSRTNEIVFREGGRHEC
jgi:hypothetical protein